VLLTGILKTEISFSVKIPKEQVTKYGGKNWPYRFLMRRQLSKMPDGDKIIRFIHMRQGFVYRHCFEPEYGF
jgi:hypothetical protein